MKKIKQNHLQELIKELKPGQVIMIYKPFEKSKKPWGMSQILIAKEDFKYFNKKPLVKFSWIQSRFLQLGMSFVRKWKKEYNIELVQERYMDAMIKKRPLGEKGHKKLHEKFVKEEKKERKMLEKYKPPTPYPW